MAADHQTLLVLGARASLVRPTPEIWPMLVSLTEFDFKPVRAPLGL